MSNLTELSTSSLEASLNNTGSLEGSLAGTRGPAGYYFTPSVSDAGLISWTNNGGLTNPETKNIKGPQGETGNSGVYLGSTEPTDTDVKVWVNPNGTVVDSPLLQFSTIPTASSTYVGNIIEYVGTTDSFYTKGYFYNCVATNTSSPATLTLTSTGTAGLGTLTGNVSTFGDKIDNYEDTYIFEYKAYPNAITVVTASDGNKTLMRDRSEDANNRYAWLTSDNVSLWTTTQVPELGTEFFSTTTENSTAFISYDDVTVTSYSDTYGRWQRDLGDDLYEDVTLSEYGISYNGVALIDSKINAVYTAEVVGNTSYVWQQMDTQPDTVADLRLITGYSPNATQVLKNVNGTFTWVNE